MYKSLGKGRERQGVDWRQGNGVLEDLLHTLERVHNCKTHIQRPLALAHHFTKLSKTQAES